MINLIIKPISLIQSGINKLHETWQDRSQSKAIAKEVASLSQEERIALVRPRLLSLNREETLKHLSDYGIKNEKRRYHLYKDLAWALQDTHIQKFDLSERHHLEIIKKMRPSSRYLYTLLATLKVPSKQKSKLILKTCRARGYMYPEEDELIKKEKGSLSLKQFIELAKRGSFEAVKNLPSEKERFRLLTSIIDGNKNDLSTLPKSIKEYQLTNEHHFEIAKKLAPKQGSELLSFLENFELTDTQLKQLAPLLTVHNYSSLSNIHKLKLENPLSLFQDLLFKSKPLFNECPLESLPNQLKGCFKSCRKKSDIFQLPSLFANSKKLFNTEHQAQVQESLFTELFKPLFRKYQKDENNLRFLMLAEHFCKILAWKHGFSLDDDQFKALVELTENLLEWGTLEQRVQLTLSLFPALANRVAFDLWFTNLPRNEQGRYVPHCIIPCAFYAICKPNEQEHLHFVANIKKARMFRDGKKQRILACYFDAVRAPHLSTQQKQTLIKLLFHEKEDPSVRASYLSDILSIAPKYLFHTKPPSIEGLQIARRELFLKAFGIKDAKNIEKIDQLLSQWRDPNAFAAYLGKIKALPPKQRDLLEKHYRSWMESLFNDSFKKWRRQNSAHLQQLSSLGIPASSIDQWEQGMEKEEIQFNGHPDKRPVHFRLKEFLHEKLIVDGHIEQFEKTCPHTYRFLKKEPSPNSQIQKGSLDEQLLKLCQEDITEGQIGSLHASLAGQASCQNFRYDLTEFLRKEAALRSLPDETRMFDIFDSDDAQDLFLLGSETGGCQTVYGSPDLNKSAMAYVSDAKNRAIVVKDKSGKKSIARAVLRLLWDEQAKKPALFLERTYASYPDPRFEIEIRNYAKKIGQKLQLPLYEAGKEEAVLQSFGCHAPFEYSDAGGGSNEGSFTIRGVKPL
jgi:hypothetical protein